MRIYNDPNHPHYGPARRLWVILAQLDMLTTAEEAYGLRGISWDHALGIMLNRKYRESVAQRVVLAFVLRQRHGMCNP